uniref:Uncharacterized protein n=1 Tax=viral metagenome TaxID=1070528 RepID=A0A6C0CJY4_9ZZZZ
MPSRCLILATYNGDYTQSERNARVVPVNNLKVVLDHIVRNTNANSWNKIIVAVACESNPQNVNKQYDEYLQSIDYPNVEVLRKQNDKWLSYSSYYEAYKKYPDYDTYYFFEDDYMPTDKLIQLVNNKLAKVDYIFGYINHKHPIEHASHALCISKGSILKTVFQNYYVVMASFNHAHQIAFYMMFKKYSQFKSSDLSDTRCIIPFYRTKTNDIILYFGNWNQEIIIYPTQYFYLNKKSYPNGRAYDFY